MDRENNTPDHIEEREERTLAERSPIVAVPSAHSTDSGEPETVVVPRKELKDLKLAIDELKYAVRHLVEYPEQKEEGLEILNTAFSEIEIQFLVLLAG
jgi:hypothetical protein